MNHTRNIVFSGLMIAMGIAIVSVLRNFGGQPIMRLFSPMHICVLIAGLAIGKTEGLLVGILTPLLSFMINGSPQIGPWAMMVELGLYGFLTGLLMEIMRKWIPSFTVRMYIALICAMIVGRIGGGLVQGLILSPMLGQVYTLQAWFAAYFIGTIPAIIFDLTIIPMLIYALKRGNLIKKLHI